MPLGALRLGFRADDRLEVDLHELVGEVLLARGTRAAPDSCRPSVSSKLPPMAMRQRPATLRMFSMIRSNVPWPPRSGRIRLCVSRSPSSVILMPFSPNGSSRSTTSGVSSRPLVMMVIDHRHAARLRRVPQPLGQVVHHRQVQQRLAAEERQHELLGVHAIELALDPVADTRRASRATSSRRTCCSRRDRPGSSSRRRSCTAASSARVMFSSEVSLLTRVEDTRRALAVDRVAVRRRGSRSPTARSKASRSSSSDAADRIAGRDAAVEQRRDVGRHDELRVGQRVHQEHFVALGQRHTKIEHRRLHDRLNSRSAVSRRR